MARSIVRVDLVMPSVGGLGDEAVALLRPQLREWIKDKATDLVRSIQAKLFSPGSGREYSDGKRASLPGQAPAYIKGDYQRSWDSDVKDYKRSIQGRVGSMLWQRFGKTLEQGNDRIRARPHAGPAADRWMIDVKRDIEANQ